jgi:AAA+ superfamily predicted ATPase
MRAEPVSVTGTTLAFDRAGKRLLAVEPDAVAVVDLAASKTTRIECGDVRAVAGFDDQLWIATHGDTLVRLDPAGRTIGEPIALPFAARAILVAAPCGAPGAVWLAAPALAVFDDFGQLAAHELPEADATIPLTGRRFVVARGGRVTLPSGVVAQLAPSSIVLGGAVMTDGKAVTLLVARDGGRQLIVIALANGQPTARCAVPTTATVRVATKGYVAVVQSGPRGLAIVDLRTGRELGTAVLRDDAHDIAVDPAGRRLAARSHDGIELHDIAELLRRPAEPAESSEPTAEPRPPEIAASAGATIEAAEPLDPSALPSADAPGDPAPAPGAPPRFVCPPLVALAPRRRPAPIEPAPARAQLDRELRSVSLWTLGAIAAAWDSRRLGYGNEGRHPYELEVAAILGMGVGFAAEYVAAAGDSLAEHQAALAADPQWRAPGTAVGELMSELGLSHRAVDVLLVVAAAALLGETARLYGILANDPGRPLVDELLVQQVLAARYARHDLAEELDPRAPLIRLGVVQISSRRARPFAELTVDPVVLDRLRAIPPELGAATTLRTATCALAALDVARSVLDHVTAALARAPRGPGSHAPVRLVVRGRIGAGRRTLVAALAAEAERDVAVIDAMSLPRTAEAFVAELHRALRRAHLAGHVPCLVHLDDVTFDERAGRDVAADLLRAHPGPIAVIAAPGSPTPFPAGHVAVELPIIPETERREVWRRAIAEAGLRVADLDLLAARYKIGPGVIRAAVSSVEPGDGDHDGDDATAAIDAFVRQTRDARLGQYARRVDRLASWSSVVFPPDILDSLRELVARMRHGRTVFETWGMDRTMATSRGLTALFQGPPGTGKTLVAGVVARELGLDLYQVDLSKVMSKWIGETERNLSTIFDAAEDGQVVLLFDEADSLFAKRTEVRSSNDRYANLEVNYLLQRLDSFEGIAILTTNNGTSIDQAFKRRMSFRLSFPFPDEDTREQLWRAHLPPELPIAGPLALDQLARKYQLSGGYIRNACLRAAFLAAQDETSLHQRHLERAVSLEFAELGKLSSGGTLD